MWGIFEAHDENITIKQSLKLAPQLGVASIINQRVSSKILQVVVARSPWI